MKNLKIGQQIFLVTGVIILIFTLNCAWLYTRYRDQLFEGRKHLLVRQVDTAWSVIDHFSRQTDHGMEEEKAKILALEAIKDLLYDE